MSERGGSKRDGGPPLEGNKFSFKSWCLKWPILTEITVKYGIIFILFANNMPPVVLSGGGVPPPPWRKP